MKKTGKFLTKEETKRIFGMAKEASRTPVIAFTTKDALSGHDLASDAWRSVYNEANRLAKLYGLPDIEGNYGVCASGEILAP